MGFSPFSIQRAFERNMASLPFFFVNVFEFCLDGFVFIQQWLVEVVVSATYFIIKGIEFSLKISFPVFNSLRFAFEYAMVSERNSILISSHKS